MGSLLGLLGATCTRMGVVTCEETSSLKVACFRFLCDFLEADSMVGIVSFGGVFVGGVFFEKSRHG